MAGLDESSIPGGIELAPRVRVAEWMLRWQFARSSGPGGQNVNKVNTKAELWIALSALAPLSQRALARLQGLAGKRLTSRNEIHIASDTERTQEGNRAAALERLKELLVAAMHEPKARRKTKPSRGAKERRLKSKKHRSAIKSRRRGEE
jgi:ribosome-associated protein